jgi:hypothetical protein
LNHAAVMNASVFDNRPCPMFLAVLATNLEAQKHDADSRLAHGRARSLVGTTGVCSTSALQNQALVAIKRPENRKNRVHLVKSG